MLLSTRAQATPLIVFLILTLPAVLGAVYFLYLQIFVTQADLILNAVAIAFQVRKRPTIESFR